MYKPGKLTKRDFPQIFVERHRDGHVTIRQLYGIEWTSIPAWEARGKTASQLKDEFIKRVNFFRQRDKSSNPERGPIFPSDTYKGEFFAKPGPHAIEGTLVFKGRPKLYKMGYLQGYPHIEVESYPGEGVIVSYLMTGTTCSWEWKYRNEAWDWARTRALHIQMLKNPLQEYRCPICRHLLVVPSKEKIRPLIEAHMRDVHGIVKGKQKNPLGQSTAKTPDPFARVTEKDREEAWKHGAII